MLESMLVQGKEEAGSNKPFPVPPLSEFKAYYDHPDEDKFVGYYGIYGYTDVINTASLISLCGLSGIATQRVAYPNWFKFFIDGKIIYTSHVPIASDVTWDTLNDLGLVYGSKIISISGKKYKVRLFKTLPGDADSYKLPRTPALDNNKPFYTEGSEYNRTILNCCKNSPQPGERAPGSPPWDIYTGEMLSGTAPGNFVLSYTWMQEEFFHYDGRKGRIQRPSLNVTANISHAWFFDRGEVAAYSCTWRPVLELVND